MSGSNTNRAVQIMTKEEPGDSGAKPVDARVARRRQDALGRRLRQMYDEVVGEDVPADFLALLGKADDASPGKGDANGEDIEPARNAVGSKK